METLTFGILSERVRAAGYVAPLEFSREGGSTDIIADAVVAAVPRPRSFCKRAVIRYIYIDNPFPAQENSSFEPLHGTQRSLLYVSYVTFGCSCTLWIAHAPWIA